MQNTSSADTRPSFLPAILVSCFACVLLFIYAPAEYYFTNLDEFLYDIYNLLSVMLPIAAAGLALSLLAFFLARALGRAVYNICLLLYFGASLILYLQGTFFSSWLPSLENPNIDWSAYTAHRPESIFLAAAVALLLFLAARFLRQPQLHSLISGVSGALLAMLLLASVLNGITSGGFTDKADMLITDEGIMTMSDDENFIILLLDAVSSEGFSDRLAAHPEYADTLQDFTWYPDTLSGYPYTKYSLPLILTGEWYEAQASYGDFRNTAFASSPLLASLEAENYSLGTYDHDLISVSSLTGRIHNVETSKGLATPLKFAVMQLELVGFRYLPFDLKRFSVIDSYSMYLDTFMSCDEGNEYFEQLNNVYALLQSPVTVVPEKQFKFIYTVGAHVPFGYDSEVNLTDDATYESCIEACMTIVDAYLSNLRASGVYDNSVIVIMADHGFNGDNVNEGRQNPLLLVKGRGESHPFASSDVPVSHAELQEVFAALLAGAQGDEAFPHASGDTVTRRYLFHDGDSNLPLEEYLLTGDARDTDALQPTGKIYS